MTRVFTNWPCLQPWPRSARRRLRAVAVAEKRGASPQISATPFGPFYTEQMTVSANLLNSPQNFHNSGAE